MTVNINERLVVDASDFITQGIGTKFDKVELLQLADFSTLAGKTITVVPKSAAAAGSYPFIVRVFDK